MSIDIDHVFIVRPAGSPLPGFVGELGLVEQYRRDHPGQGTRNVCFAFDNLYLEFLWLVDEAEARSTSIRRTGLLERSQSQNNEICPFGIAWRRHVVDSDAVAKPDGFAVPTWPFRPPYLPQDLSIAVAPDSDDLSQPLMFESPGNAEPNDWPAERKGSLQHDARLGRVSRITLSLPDGVEASETLSRMAELTLLDIASGPDYQMTMVVDRIGSKDDVSLRLSC